MIIPASISERNECVATLLGGHLVWIGQKLDSPVLNSVEKSHERKEHVFLFLLVEGWPYPLGAFAIAARCLARSLVEISELLELLLADAAFVSRMLEGQFRAFG